MKRKKKTTHLEPGLLGVAQGAEAGIPALFRRVQGGEEARVGGFFVGEVWWERERGGGGGERERKVKKIISF